MLYALLEPRVFRVSVQCEPRMTLLGAFAYHTSSFETLNVARISHTCTDTITDIHTQREREKDIVTATFTHLYIAI